MGRVEAGSSSRPPLTGPGAQRHHKQLTNSSKPGYKVVLEEVTQTKKALILKDYQDLRPPIGYKFVPSGDPTLTTKCKEFARLDGKTVYAVTIGHKGSELSKQVHRVGFHFPNEIVQRALTSLGINLDQEDDVLRRHEIWPREESKRKSRKVKNLKQSTNNNLPKDLNLLDMTQEEIDAQAKAAILDMFPAIPMDNLYQIILHAFELGSDRVGVQLTDLSLPRRIQLAVVAHIRHVYTDYDNLLHSQGWQGARAMVGHKTLEVLAKWRGDKDDDNEVVEDILREVIVISDDEDESQDIESGVRTTPQMEYYAPQRPHSPPLTTSNQSYRHLIELGKSDKIGARKQIWLDAREKRREPAPIMHIRADNPYYILRSDQDQSARSAPHSYEKRLRGLETYSRRPIDDQQLPVTTRDRNTTSYTQPQLNQLLLQHSSSNNARSGNTISTPPRVRLAPQQNKLIIPSNEDILPSIETPRVDRAPTSAFAHSAIHIDSPPSEKRLDFRFLRQESIDSSPVKRKRERSPFQPRSSHFKELTYRPARDVQDPHAVDRERYDHSVSQRDKLVYVPLDSPQSVQSPYLDHRNSIQSKSYRPIYQIPLDTRERNIETQTALDSGMRYQYVPLDPVQRPQETDRYLASSHNVRMALIPLDEQRNTGTQQRSRTDVQPLPHRVPLSEGHEYRSEWRPTDEATSYRRTVDIQSDNDRHREYHRESAPSTIQDLQIRQPPRSPWLRNHEEHRGHN